MKPRQFKWVVIFWAVFLVHASATVRYVNVNNTSPASPYTSWATAAQTIQDAVDVANPGDTVLVTNGVYQTGGRPIPAHSSTNRVVVDRAVTVQSVNGPTTTVIQGHQVGLNGPTGYLDVRCVYLTNDALLAGFTLTNGGTWSTTPNADDRNGGGIWCETNAMVSNCVITASYSFGSGGGGYQGNYYNCSFVSHTAVYFGGGAVNSTLINCTVTGNLQWHSNLGNGGGVYSCTLSNCTLTGNQESSNNNGDGGGGGGHV